MARALRWPARTLVCMVLAAVCWIAAGGAALAHPLGNFTVNRYSRVELNGDSVRVRYVLDLAEIPSVQEARAASTNSDGTVSLADWDVYKQRKAVEIERQLELTVDNQRLSLQPTDVVVLQPLGQGDIRLVRLQVWFKATETLVPHVQHQATFRDRSDPARLGWREVVVHAATGAALAESSVPDRDVSDELRGYPDDLLQNPLDRREAHWTFTMDGTSAATPGSTANESANRPNDPFAALVTAAELSPPVVLLAILGAAILGGMHAASPGHGKTVMAAYLVGTQGGVLHACALALSVTLSHTTGVLVLGILTVLASNLFFPEQLYPWLTLVSGVIVLVIGLWFLLAIRRRPHEHEHDHEHHHDHGHKHEHAPSGLVPTWRGLFALGLAGGIVPSGSALVVLLSSVALGRLGFGLVLIVAFGLGMAIVLVATGVLLVHASRLMLRLLPDRHESPTGRRLAALVPVVSASVMTLLGGVATIQGLSQIGALGS